MSVWNNRDGFSVGEGVFGVKQRKPEVDVISIWHKKKYNKEG